MRKTSRLLVWTMGFLSTAGPVCMFLLASEDLRKLSGPWCMIWIGAVGVGCQNLLAYLNRTFAAHHNQDDPVPVVNAKDTKLATTEDPTPPTPAPKEGEPEVLAP